jgi:hypothetical protein
MSDAPQKTIPQKVDEILEGHALDCRCDVCRAYVMAPTPAAGLLAAAEVLRKRENAPFTKYVN